MSKESLTYDQMYELASSAAAAQLVGDETEDVVYDVAYDNAKKKLIAEGVDSLTAGKVATDVAMAYAAP